MSETRKVTIETIAKICNTSIGTVDRALHNRSGISSETRKKILETAARFGYHTNRVDVSLFDTSKFRHIAYIDYCTESPLHERLQAGIRRKAKEIEYLNFGVDYYDALHMDNQAQKDLISKINNSEYEGLILNALYDDPSYITSRINPNPELMIASSVESKYFVPDIRIGGDADICGCMAADLAGGFARKDENVAVITTFESKYTFVKRFSGFCRVIKKEYPQINLVPFICKYTDIEEAVEEILPFIEKNNISVIHSTDFNGTLGAIRAVKELEIKDIQLIGYDLCEESVQALSDGYCKALLYHDTLKYGVNSVEFLARKILAGNDGAGSREYIVYPEIVMKYNVDHLLHEMDGLS